MKNENTRIFIVEDDCFFSELINSFLLNRGYIKIKKYESGIDCINNLHQNPDVIILDYGLKDKNGIDTLKEIKSINPNIDVIFLSGQDKIKVAVTSLKYGAYDYIEKTDKCIHILKKVLINISKSKQLITDRGPFFKIKSYINSLLV